MDAKRSCSSRSRSRSRSSSSSNSSCVGGNSVAGGGEERREPCGACKFLRRRCAEGCVFAPHFGGGEQQQQGGGASSASGAAARFAAVHKVFGASNVAKLLTGQVPPARRRDAVLTICYEAQARLADPVYGCVSTILALQHQASPQFSHGACPNTLQGDAAPSRAIDHPIPTSEQQVGPGDGPPELAEFHGNTTSLLQQLLDV